MVDRSWLISGGLSLHQKVRKRLSVMPEMLAADDGLIDEASVQRVLGLGPIDGSTCCIIVFWVSICFFLLFPSLFLLR